VRNVNLADDWTPNSNVHHLQRRKGGNRNNFKANHAAYHNIRKTISLEEKLTMKKFHWLISILVLATLVLGACAPAAPTAAPETEAPPAETEAPPAATEAPAQSQLPDLGGRVITVAIENAYLPFNYVRLDTGEAEGWDYDFLNESCKRLNCSQSGLSSPGSDDRCSG
jgi:hypothetical protein